MTAVVAADTSILSWSDSPITVQLDTADSPEYLDGEMLGSITWTAGPRTATTRVLVDGEIAPPSAWWRLTHPQHLSGWPFGS